MTVPKPPKTLRTAGRAFWRAVMEDFELDDHELALFRQACHVVDSCADLQAAVDADGPTVGSGEKLRAHPALVELRQQRIVLARLMAALRLPMGQQEDDKHVGTARAQRRTTRGVYGIRGTA